MAIASMLRLVRLQKGARLPSTAIRGSPRGGTSALEVDTTSSLTEALSLTEELSSLLDLSMAALKAPVVRIVVMSPAKQTKPGSLLVYLLSEVSLPHLIPYPHEKHHIKPSSQKKQAQDSARKSGQTSATNCANCVCHDCMAT